ncbi:hypothetical protein GSI_11425 [Ganoderma sinense ZZ0214-1]|uniref:Uncharacterized protein n=1 Tax=Ganoderma sinense ZZ0214-1 TaxID=1077348 RepID=A0A2G8RVY4_9APHY|nr:hypothetical protein GSI_11425 [Ganoderma sinense ZZ0214-1]
MATMDSVQAPEFAFEMSCSKTACDWCRKVAAWPIPKSVLKSRSRDAVPAIYQVLGRATMPELMHETLLWLQTHMLSLTIIANALVDVGGGLDTALDPDAPHVIIFNLGPPRAYDGTPATAFTLESLSLDDPCHAHNVGPDPQWSHDMAALASRRAGVDSVLAGIIPITVCLRDAQWETSLQTALPLCRPQRAAGEVMDDDMRGMLRNVMRMCTGGINAGIVLHMPEDPQKTMPDMGKVVLEGRSWTWTPHDRAVLVGSLGDDGEPSGLAFEFLRYFDPELSPDPVDCFVTYHQLWPYHLIRDAAMRVLDVYPELEPYTR